MSNFRQCPTVYTMARVAQIAAENKPSASRDGSIYYPARPLNAGFCGDRLRAAWLVWTGRADVFTWPGGQ